MVSRPTTWRLVAIVLALMASRAEAGFTIQDLGLIAPNGTSAGQAINGSGQVAGIATGADESVFAVRSSAGGTFQEIPAPHASSSFATGIDGSGSICGTVVDATDGSVSAFSLVGDSFLKFGPLEVDGHPGGATFASGIAGGQVVGTGLITGRMIEGAYVSTGLLTPTAFRGSGPGSLTIIDPLGTGLANFGNGINGAGTVVGTSEISINGPLHAFLAGTDGRATDLLDRNSAGSFTSNTEGIAINDRGDVVGSGIIGNRSHAYFASRSGGDLVDLGLFGGTSSRAFGVNDLDNPVVVGQVFHGTSSSSAFLWQSGVGMIDLRSLLSTGDQATWTLLSLASGVNDSNQIAGTGLIDGQMHGFLMTPEPGSPFFRPAITTPTPPALPMLAIGCAFAGVALRVRRGRTSG